MATGLRCALAVLLGAILLQADELSVDQAVQIARQHNLEIANTGLDVAKAKDRSGAFRGQLLPKLSFYGLGSYQLRPVEITVPSGSFGMYKDIGPIPAQDVKYSTPTQPTGFLLGRISQPLSGIYRTRLNLKALDFSTQVAGQKTRAKRQDVVRNVKQFYYKIEQLQSSLVAVRQSIQLYR
jgi:outer membrane protein TolC